jgi:hypothetical protein
MAHMTRTEPNKTEHCSFLFAGAFGSLTRTNTNTPLIGVFGLFGLSCTPQHPAGYLCGPVRSPSFCASDRRVHRGGSALSVALGRSDMRNLSPLVMELLIF